MPVSDEKKIEVRRSLIGYTRGHQHTAAAGIALYNDGNYGEICKGKSGGWGDVERVIVVKNHLADNNTGKQGGDAEVHVLNDLGVEFIYYQVDDHGQPSNISPTDVFLYIEGPHDFCPACKRLIVAFQQSFGVAVQKQWVQKKD